MKTMRKILSLLLATCLIMSMICVSYAAEVQEITLPDKVFDLDISGFAATSTVGANGAQNAIPGGTAQIFFQNKSGYGAVATLTKKAMTTASGEQTEYINYAKTGDWNHSSQAYIVDPAWENEDTTFSFWITKNYTNTNSVPLAAYNLIYDVSGTVTKKGVALWEISDYLWNNENSMTTTVAAKEGWNHVVIVNRKADNDRNKIIDLYMNGALWESVTLTVPENATLTENSLSFGADRYLSGVDALRKGNNDFGKVQAYKGALTAEEIAYLCESQKSAFVPLDLANASKLFDLDLTNFKATSTAGANGAENLGTSETDEIVIYNYSSANGSATTSTKKQMSNKNFGITNYITHEMKWNGKESSKMYISDEAWEAENTTISFWVTPNMSGDAKVLASYNLTYEDASGAATTINLPIWRVTTAGFNTGYTTSGCAAMNRNGFNQIVIVNRKADSSGNKSFDIYVNGTFYKNVIITQPAETTLKDAVLSFGEYYPSGAATYDIHSGPFNYGKVQVYKGILGAGDIKKLYDMHAPEFEALALEDAEKLLELNLDNFIKTKDPGASGITNSGTSQTANIDIYSTEQVSVRPQQLKSKDLKSVGEYIYMEHPFGSGISSGTALARHFNISDTEWTKQPVTISFWADLDRSRQQTADQGYAWIATYNVDYKNSDGTIGNAESGLWQHGLDTSNPYWWGKGSWKYDIDMSASREWSHIVFAISDNKTIRIYVNGVDRGTVELKIPEGAEATNATLRFGANRANTYIPGDLSVSDVKVYKALLTGEYISEIYNAEKSVYANVGESKIKFKYNGNVIYRLGNKNNVAVPNDGTASITIEYTESINPDCMIIAAAYDVENNLVSSEEAVSLSGNDSGSFELPIKPGTKYVKVFTWENETLSPIHRIDNIQYNDN